MPRIILLLLLSLGAASAAITNLTVVGTTATQAVVSYNAPDANACTIQASVNANLSPLAYDVDPSTFASSDTDLSRASTVSSGVNRVVVIGARFAHLATAGTWNGIRHFSHALQAATPYYGLITCPSTGDTAAFTFTTANIPLGQTYGEPWLSDGAGGQPWPEMPGAAHTENFVDPRTGSLVTRVGLRGNRYGSWTGMPLSTARNQGVAPCTNGNWTNPCNAIGASSYATVGNSTGWLSLRNLMANSGSDAWYSYTGNESYTGGAQIDQLALNLTAYASACAGDTCKLDACISMNDGYSCAGQIQTVTLTTSPAAYTFGAVNTSNFGADTWSFDTAPRFNVQESFPHTGQAIVSGTTLSWQQSCGASCTSATFSLYWLHSTIRLSPTSQANACAPLPASNDSTEYTVQSYTDGNNITLSGSPPQGAVYFCAQPFSVMVRRHAADANTVSVKSASLAASESYFQFNLPSNGANTATYDTAVGGGWFNLFGGLTWYDPATGEIRFYGDLYVPPGPSANPWLSAACPGNNAAFWDQAAPIPTIYCSTTLASGKMMVIRARISGGVPPNPTAPYDANSLAFEGSCSNTDNYTVTCAAGGGVSVIWDTLTPTSLTKTINDQIAVLDPGIAAKVTAWAGSTNRADQLVEKSVFYFNLFAGNQDSPGIMFAFNPGDGVPAHAGALGGPALAGAITTYNTGPAITNPTTLPPQTSFYGHTLHALIETGGTGWVAMAGNNSTYEIVNTTHSPIPAPGMRATCVSLGVAGNPNQCVQLAIDSYTHASVTGYEPYLTNSSTISGSDLLAPFLGTPGELRTMQIGDLACAGYAAGTSPILNGNCYYGPAEMLMLVAKSGGTWTLQTGMYGGIQQGLTSGAQIALWWSSLQTAIPASTPTASETAYWNPLTGCSGSPDPHGVCMIQNTNETNSHQFARDGSATVANNVPTWDAIPGPANGQWPFGYQSSPGAVPYSISYPFANFVPNAVPGVNIIHGNPAFAGATGGAWSGEASSHPVPPAESSGAYEQGAAFDDLTFAGAALFALDPIFTNVTGQLYTASLAVTDPDDIGYLNRKVLATAASCGNHPLSDLSGPASVIDGTIGNSYKYCAVRVNGECYSGSTAGQLYVNCPGLIPPYTCNGNGLHGASQLGVGNDVCVHNAAAALNAIDQYAITGTDFAGAGRRSVIAAIGRIRMSPGFDNLRVMPDNSAYLYDQMWPELQAESLWLAKALPLPPADSVPRWNFVPVTPGLAPSPAIGASNALIEFGYQEYGAPAALKCTTRNDVCVAQSAAIPTGNAPFAFASEAPGGLACPTNCSIAVPGISQRVLYYRVKYLSAGNVLLFTGPVQVAVVP